MIFYRVIIYESRVMRSELCFDTYCLMPYKMIFYMIEPNVELMLLLINFYCAPPQPSMYVLTLDPL